MFYDKPASKLTLPESALLAGLPQAPSQYNPFLNPSGALTRRAEVLRAMVKAGSISQAEGDRGAQAKIGVKQNRFYTQRREQYFFDYVTSELFKRYGVKRVRQGGLKITTTVDLKLQKQARQSIANRLGYPGDPASAIVSVDPRNGQIRAMASSATYGKTKFDYATQAHRQPGSTFKVMVLMAALRKGISPNTTFVSHRLNAGWLPGYPSYEVETYGKTYGGRMNLLKATLTSDNTVYAQLGAEVGPQAVRKAAYDLGITSKLEALPAEAPGGLKYGVSTLEMANAYATIAARGIRHKPVAILKVVHRNGKVDNWVKTNKGKRVFPESVTWEATKILKANVQSGTGTNAAISCPAAGKTGTTSDYKDAWFVGFTPRLATGVWVGYANPPIPMRSVHGIEVAGSTFPSQIWHDFMSTAVGSHCDDFTPSPTGFQSQPFYGRFAGAGSSGGGYTGTGTGTGARTGTAAGTQSYRYSAPSPGTGNTGGGTGTRNYQYSAPSTGGGGNAGGGTGGGTAGGTTGGG